MHVFHTQIATVGHAQCVYQVTQRHFFVTKVGVVHVIGIVHIGFGKAVERRIQLRNLWATTTFERIKIGPARAQKAIIGDQRLHGHLLFAAGGADIGRLPREEFVLLGALRE